MCCSKCLFLQMGRNVLYLSKLLLTYSTVFQFTCQLFSDNTILTQFHLIDKEKTGNRMDTCLLLFTMINMTRFLILTTQSQYMSPRSQTTYLTIGNRPQLSENRRYA